MGLFDVFKKKSKPASPAPEISNVQVAAEENLRGDVEVIDSPSMYTIKQADEDFERFKKLDDQQLGQLPGVRFKDGTEAILENLSISYTYRGLLEGSPVYASRDYWERLKNQYEEKGCMLLEPTLVHSCFNDGYCLPSIKVVASFEDGLNVLSICFFTNEFPFDCSLKEFIERITLEIDFKANCVEWED